MQEGPSWNEEDSTVYKHRLLLPTPPVTPSGAICMQTTKPILIKIKTVWGCGIISAASHVAEVKSSKDGEEMTQLVNQEGHVLQTASIPGTNAPPETGCEGGTQRFSYLHVLRCRVL